MSMQQSLPAGASAETVRNDTTQFGFWVYIMTDCVLFASLFAAYAVLHNATAGGPGGDELFKLPTVLAETLILLTSSLTCGLALLAARNGRKQQALVLLGATFVLGATFLALEIAEFRQLVIEGNSWRRNAFLSSFFTLVGTHGLHITAGLIWLAVLAAQIKRKGFTPNTLRRLALFGMFWHFLDVIWIFIFSIVYMIGSLS